MTAGRDLLRIESLSVAFPFYGGVIEALHGVSLRVLPGRVTALVGQSGSGKSVIGRAILGLHPDHARISGRILFDDPAIPAPAPVDLAALPADGRRIRAVRGNRIGMIFQEPMSSLSPVHRIGAQIDEALRIHSALPPRERAPRIEQMLADVGFADPRGVMRAYPFELSGGMRQRAMVAMALICRPALLIADEPTTALDVTIQAQLLKLLRGLQERLGMAMLMITHDLGVVANMADEVVVIHHGRIVEQGPTEAIFRRPRHAYLRALIAAVPHFDMAPGERLRPLVPIPVDPARLLHARPGAAPAPAAPPPAARPEPPLLVVEGLTKSFASRAAGLMRRARPQRVVEGVSLSIARGRTLGLVGESGSGKTTVGKMIVRAIPADGGRVWLGGEDVLSATGADLMALRRRMQMVFQDPVSSLSPHMTVGAILSEPFEIHGIGTPASRRMAARELLRAVGLSEADMGRYPHSFSGGQRQRIGIARALALGPELIVCDEATSALDVSVQAQVLNLIRDLQAELGLTCLFISHNLAVVNYMAEDVAVMQAGRIVEIGPRDIILRQPVHPYTRALLAAVPYPDLDRPLDLGALKGAAEASWPAAFRGPGLVEIDLGEGHRVLARPGADPAGQQA